MELRKGILRACSLLLLAPSLLLAGASGGDFANMPTAPADTSLSPHPGAWEAANGGTWLPQGGGFARTGSGLVSADGISSPILRFDHATIGASISQKNSDFFVGDYCTYFPVPPSEIDWIETGKGIRNGAASKNGYIAFFPSGESEERILFTRNGACKIEWVLQDGTRLERSYSIGLNTSLRPYRLFWTEQPYGAPRVSLAKKTVKLFGDPSIIKPTYEKQVVSTDPYIAVSNVINGVYLDHASSVLRAYASSAETGPRGQFVLAYFSVEGEEVPAETIVVQVGPPDCATLEARVGDELRPYGGGYAVSNLTAFIQAGLEVHSTGNPYSPYVEQFHAGTPHSEMDGAIFAIVPTDGSTDGGDAVPWSIDIYWQMPDRMGTLWPFEEDWYLVSWPEKSPVLVVGDKKGDEMAGAYLGKDYVADVCDYNDLGKDFATISSNQLYCSDAGRFTLRLQKDDSLWFLPMQSVSHADTNVFDLSEAPWTVGMELRPRQGAAAGKAAELASLIDPELPGFLYRSAGTGDHYNRDLYHPPVYGDEVPAIGSASENPFDTLISSIYPVNEHEKPLEVWWYRSYAKAGMPTEIVIPALVQRYRPTWPGPGDTHDIVLASGQGSAAPALAASGAALYLDSPESQGNLPAGAFAGLEAYTFFFRFNVAPRAAGPSVRWSEGELVSLETTDGGSLRFSLAETPTNVPVLSVTRRDGSGGVLARQEVPVRRDDWTHVVLTMDSRREEGARLFVEAKPVGALGDGSIRADSSIAFGKNDGKVSASGVALDEFVLLDGVSTAEEILHHSLLPERMLEDERVLLELGFDDPTDLRVFPGTPIRHAADTALGETAVFLDVLAMEPGAPSVTKGILQAQDEVPPVLYYNNEPGTPGFNPNEEHAFLTRGPEGYVAWALRNDLNGEKTSRPFVLVNYNAGGKGAMAIFDVQVTNALFPRLESEVIAGNLLDGPHPLTELPGYHGPYSYVVPDSSDAPDAMPVYRDRMMRFWARRDGGFSQYNYYPLQEGFYFPKGSKPLPTGTMVGWMNCVGLDSPTQNNLTENRPLAWHWKSVWPETNAVPTMRVAQTLTKAIDGLPEVWNARSVAVCYPSTALDTNAQPVVDLIDPTVARTAPLAIKASFPDEYGFTTGSAGTCRLRSGKYYFSGLPPTISDRFYIDTSADPQRAMVLVGRLVDPAAGVSYLQLNVLSADERTALKAACPLAPSHANKKAWDAAVDRLARGSVHPSPQKTAFAKGSADSRSALPGADHRPADHYGLVANGKGAGWVTIIENDSTNTAVVPEGAPVSMHLLRVDPSLYTAPLVVHEDPANKLSEQLSILYTSPFGDASTNFVFEWRKVTPPADGTVPTDYPAWPTKASAPGLTELQLGGAGASLAELVNTYFVMRYRPKKGTPVHELLGDRWSDWCGPTLAEGWVQRVLKNVTPFAQRLDDFYENATELAYTMAEQIGGPYRGDVALNNENLGEVGLLELYQTVLNKAESLSLRLGINDPNANKQLLEAVSRLADLYGLLGDDAFADSMNPTIGMSPSGTLGDRKLTTAGSAFSFQNQLPSLLDEELALLRGRSAAVAPGMRTYPYYNRLIWNFTTGITEGELAYVMNYNIQGNNGKITVEEAASQYPMGHGDAYGHYLSGIWGYYRLLRNPSFSWGDPGMMEMLVADSIVNMDYEDEQKFAVLAEKLAKTGAITADLTARKTWRDQGARPGAGYLDQNEEQAFGYGQWAVRGGLGALYNWATVNSLLPDDPTNGTYYFADRSIKEVDRGTVPALETLAQRYEELQRGVDKADAGLNPLGLSDNAVPFDIDPSKLDGKVSHFEQILDRTRLALENAKIVLDRANLYGSRLAKLQEQEGDDATRLEREERAFTADLISLFGTPWPGDIGPGGTYPQGYDGPDIFHYMWTDLGPYGLDGLETTLVTNIVLYEALHDIPYFGYEFNPKKDAEQSITVRYDLAPGGIIKKPSHITGRRRTEGAIQAAYRDYLAAYVSVLHCQTIYEGRVIGMIHNSTLLKTRLGDDAKLLAFQEILNSYNSIVIMMQTVHDISSLGLEASTHLTEAALDDVMDVVPKIVGAGMTVNYDPSSVASASAIPANAAVNTAYWTAKLTMGGNLAAVKAAAAEADNLLKMFSQAASYYGKQVSWYKEAVSDVIGVRSAAYDLQNAFGKLSAAEAAYRAKVAKGDALLSEREMRRKQDSNSSVAKRYQDMFHRVQRNTVLSQYHAAFDTAQRYVYQLAKVYDYETGLLSDDKQAGDRFLREIVTARTIGTPGLAISPSGGDAGLWNVVAQMAGNWNVLKGRLGINNPTPSTKWFSLRYSLFRIEPGAEGDAAWEKELRKYWVDDILSDREFTRYCQPPVSSSGPLGKEPGLIIPFSTSINVAENLFGKPLMGGEEAYSSSDYATKIRSVGIAFDGYNVLTNGYRGRPALASSPNIYLVPAGTDYMRAPAGNAGGRVIGLPVVDQVIPLPYAIGSTELDDAGWVPSVQGLDGTSDSFATIRRHSTMAEGATTDSSRLVGRSVWNDRWLLVIPASSLHSDRARGLETFLHGADFNGDGVIDQRPVSDIRLGLRTYSRSGN